MTQKKTRQKQHSGTLQIEEELTIGNVEKIRDTLLQEMDKHEIEEINFKNVTQIDLSGLQLIESLKKSFTLKGKELKIRLDLSPEYIDILINTGFSNYIKLVTQL